MQKKIIIAFTVLFVCLSCSVKKSNRQLFEEQLDLNIKSCSEPFIQRGVDSLDAKEVCRCILTKMYDVDSTFFLKSKVDMESLFSNYWSDISEECLQLVEQYFSESKNE